MATLPPSLPRSRAKGLPFGTRGRSQRGRARDRAAARLHVPQVRGSTRKDHSLLAGTVEAAQTTRTSRRGDERRGASTAGSAGQAAETSTRRARSCARPPPPHVGGGIGCWWKHREAGEKRGETGGELRGGRETRREPVRARARCRVSASQTSRAAHESSHEPDGGSIGAWEHGLQTLPVRHLQLHVLARGLLLSFRFAMPRRVGRRSNQRHVHVQVGWWKHRVCEALLQAFCPLCPLCPLRHFAYAVSRARRQSK